VLYSLRTRSTSAARVWRVAVLIGLVELSAVAVLAWPLACVTFTGTCHVWRWWIRLKHTISLSGARVNLNGRADGAPDLWGHGLRPARGEHPWAEVLESCDG